jgi:lamin tail-like protein
MRIFFAMVIAAGFVMGLAAQDNLLISEIVVTPTDGEFIEIYNPNGTAVDLTNYYLADKWHSTANSRYPYIVDGTISAAGFNDFVIQFPSGASIAPAEAQTVALGTAEGFSETYGIAANYEVVAGRTASEEVGVPDMIETNVSTSSFPGLTNSQEALMLFYWDGATDIVTDIDYLTWGTPDTDCMDKTGLGTDGPDGDSVVTNYLADTAFGSQLAASSPAFGFSLQRVGTIPTEGAQTGPGNGESNTDETSEDFSNTSNWISTEAPTPGVQVPVELSVFSTN